MSQFIQQSVAGLGIGMIYGALALALVFAHRSTGVVNFAQGNMGLFGAYFCWSLYYVGVPIWLAILISICGSFVLGAILYGLAIWPLRSGPPDAVIPAAIGLFLFLMGAAGYLWGYLIRPFPGVFGSGFVRLGSLSVDTNSLGTIAVTAVMLVGLFVMFEKTRFGLALRAVGQEPALSKYVGIRVSRMLLIGWSIAAAIGGLAAVLATPVLYLQPAMMMSVLVFSLAAATLGGFDNPAVAVSAGVLLGVTQNLAVAYIGFLGTELTVLIPFALVLVVLVVRPGGLGVRRTNARV